MRPVQRRSTLEALASALQVSPSEITGLPYAPSTESEAVAHAAAPALRAVLRDIELGEPVTTAPPRPLSELRSEVSAVNFYLSRDLGHGDLAWMVAGHLHVAAQAIGEPEWTALADFVRAATVGLRARERGLALAERSADALTPTTGRLGRSMACCTCRLRCSLRSAPTTAHART